MPRWSNISGPHLVVVASLAKGLRRAACGAVGQRGVCKAFRGAKRDARALQPALAGGDPRNGARAGDESCLRRSLAVVPREIGPLFPCTSCAGWGWHRPAGCFQCRRSRPCTGSMLERSTVGLLRAGVSTVLHRRHEEPPCVHQLPYQRTPHFRADSTKPQPLSRRPQPRRNQRQDPPRP